jgi:hypothetical protein
MTTNVHLFVVFTSTNIKAGDILLLVVQLSDKFNLTAAVESLQT